MLTGLLYLLGGRLLRRLGLHWRLAVACLVTAPAVWYTGPLFARHFVPSVAVYLVAASVVLAGVGATRARLRWFVRAAFASMALAALLTVADLSYLLGLGVAWHVPRWLP